MTIRAAIKKVASFLVVRPKLRVDGAVTTSGSAPVLSEDRMKSCPLVIELTAACNAQCPGCFPQYLNLAKGFFDLGAVHDVITSYVQRGGETLALTARGEPLLDKRIPDVVRYAKESGISYVEFTTNAQLLTPSMSRRLLECRLDTLRISMTGASQQTYSRWQGYDSKFRLEHVEANVLRFIGLRNALGRTTPRVAVRYIYDGTKDNDDAIAYLRRWVLLADDVQFTLRLPVLHNGRAAVVKKPQDIPTFFSSGEGKIRCPAVHSHGGGFAVTSEGDVSLCNSALGDPELTVGNLVKEPFDTVLDRYFDEMSKLDDLMNSGAVSKLPKACQSCFGIVEGGNNCQDFDLLLLMAVARTIDRAVDLAVKKDQPIILVGSTVAATMLMINSDFNERVKYVVPTLQQQGRNPFSAPNTFKGRSIRDKIAPNDAALAVVVVANDAQSDQAEKVVSSIDASERKIIFRDELAMVNANTFKMPSLDDVYKMPWPMWHTQMQNNYYMWQIVRYLRESADTILLSVGDFYTVDKLLQLENLVSKIGFLVRMPGLPANSPAQSMESCRGKEILSLQELIKRKKPAVLITWSAEEAKLAQETILRKNRENITVIEYNDLVRQAKDWLAFGN